ncbi:MAG: SDR family oxidoreductase [Desulfobacteraceae bacterium]
MNDRKKILVTGANGNLGGAVVKSLDRGATTVIAAGTQPENMKMPTGMAVRKIDYGQPEAVSAALKDIDGLFLVAPPLDPEAPAKLNPVIDQAKAAGVRHIVFNSALGVDQNEAAPLRVVEKYLMATGLEYTILRPNFFMENFTTGFLAPMIAQGGIFLAAGDEGTSFISVEDIAAVAAAAFEKEHFGAEYNLTGPAALNHDQIAGIISEVSGRPIQYHALTEEEMLQGARDQGLAEGAVQYMAVLYGAVRNGWMAAVTEDVEKVVSRPPVTFGEFATAHAAAWK